MERIQALLVAVVLGVFVITAGVLAGVLSSRRE